MGDARRRLTAAVTLRSLGNRRMHAQRESKTGAGCDGSTTPFLGRNVRGYVDQVSSHRLDQQIKPRRYHAPDANALQGAPRGSADRASIINHTVRHHLDRRRAAADRSSGCAPHAILSHLPLMDLCLVAETCTTLHDVAHDDSRKHLFTRTRIRTNIFADPYSRVPSLSTSHLLHAQC